MFTFEPLKDRDDHFGVNLDDGDRECFLVCLAVAVWLRTDSAFGIVAPKEISYGEAKELVSCRAVRMSHFLGRTGVTEIEVVQSRTGRMVLKFSVTATHPIELLRLTADLMRYFRSQRQRAAETEVAEVGREPLHEIDDEIAPVVSGIVPKVIEFTSIIRVA